MLFVTPVWCPYPMCSICPSWFMSDILMRDPCMAIGAWVVYGNCSCPMLCDPCSRALWQKTPPPMGDGFWTMIGGWIARPDEEEHATGCIMLVLPVLTRSIGLTVWVVLNGMARLEQRTLPPSGQWRSDDDDEGQQSQEEQQVSGYATSGVTGPHTVNWTDCIWSPEWIGGRPTTVIEECQTVWWRAGDHQSWWSERERQYRPEVALRNSWSWWRRSRIWRDVGEAWIWWRNNWNLKNDHCIYALINKLYLTFHHVFVSVQ